MEHCGLHDNCEVLYNGYNCPVCELKTELDNVSEELDTAVNRIEVLEQDVEDYRNDE